MFVSGRGTEGYGTIIPGLIEANRLYPMERVLCLTRSMNSAKSAIAKTQGALANSGSTLNLEIKSLGVDFFKELEQLLIVETYDAAIVSVPDDEHFNITELLLTKGINTLVVKPLTPDFETSMKLAQLAKRNKLLGMVEFHKRFDSANLEIRELLRSKKLGELLNVHVEYSQRIEVPTKLFNGWSDRTNILQYLGVHYIDLVRFLTKALPKRVMAVGIKQKLEKSGYNVADSMICTIEWTKHNKSDSFYQTIIAGWTDPSNSPAHSLQLVKFFGADGRVVSDQAFRGTYLIDSDSGFETINPHFCRFYTEDDGSIAWRGYGIDSIKNFIQSVNKNKYTDNTCTFHEGALSSLLIESARKSADKNGIWIDLTKEVEEWKSFA